MMRIHIERSPIWCLLLFVMTVFWVLPATQALAGCRINLYVKNTGKTTVDVKNDHWGGDDTAVKIKLGTWKNLHLSGWFYDDDKFSLDPIEKKGEEFRADFNCGSKRRYKVRYTCQSGKYRGSEFTDYYPSSTGWTEKQSVTVSLGRCK